MTYLQRNVLIAQPLTLTLMELNARHVLALLILTTKQKIAKAAHKE